MKLHLQVVTVLCALLWPACFSSLVALNRKFDLEDEEIVRIVPNVHSPTNFSALPSSSVAITAPTVPHEPTNSKNSLAKAMSTSESVSSSESSSSSSQTGGVITSTANAAIATSSMTFGPISSSSSSNTKAPSMSTSHGSPGRPTATVSPPASYTPSPTFTQLQPSRSYQPTQTVHSTPGCGPPITVTVNNGAHCTNTPSPPQACSSDCTSKIGLSLGISIPGTAILTFLVTSLSCLCCQRVKKKHSYIQLAPTVYFDEEEHD